MIKAMIFIAILLLTGCAPGWFDYVIEKDGCAKIWYQSEWICGAGYSMGKKFERDWNRGD